MSFINDAGELIITDGAEEVLNTVTDKLLHCLPPRFDGSVSRSSLAWGGSEAWEMRSADFQIATGLPSAATDIVGLVRIEYSNGYSELPSGGWYVAGGSFVMVSKDFQTISGVWGAKHCSMGVVTIYKSGTTLRFREQLALKDHYMAGPAASMAPYTLTYRLFPAAFS